MKKIFSIIFAVILGLAVFYLPAKGAADTVVWITWRATTYIPPAYTGRALPIENSDLVVAVDVISGGRTVSLANQTINWYVNDSFLKGGPGMTRTVVSVPDGAGLGGLNVRASLPDLAGGVAQTIKIPVTNPDVVLQYPRSISNRQFRITAAPFYFNVFNANTLTFNWNVSGQTPPADADPDVVDISLDQGLAGGSEIPFSVIVKNPSGVLETATANGKTVFNP